MKQRDRVLHICSYYLGTSLYQRLFDSLEKNGIKEDVYVFTDKTYEIKEEYPSNILIARCYNKMDRFIFHIKHLKVLTDIKKRVNFLNYNIVHAHSLFSNGYIAYKLNKKYNLPYIVAVRNTDVNLFFDKMLHLRKLGVDILKNSQKIIFISESYRKNTIDKFIPDNYKKEIEDKSIVIPNGIDEFWHSNKFIKTNSTTSNSINLIYIGTLDSNKNIETTIKACEILIGEGYEINFKIIGKIVDYRYNDFINKYRFIEYIPHLNKEELISHLRTSDIFIMPSKYETFGLVYAEAMSQGLPVIYTRGQGFDGQFAEGEVGYSVEYDSANEISEKVKNIFESYTNISKNCIKKVDKFDWNRIARDYIEIYKECV